MHCTAEACMIIGFIEVRIVSESNQLECYNYQSLCMPIDFPQVSRTLSGFSETMSDDEFFAYLKKEGLKEKDCSKLIGNA